MRQSLPEGFLVVERHTSGGETRLFYAAKWRASRDRRQLKRRLGPAWLTAGRDGSTRPRRGRVPAGVLDARRAYARMAEVIAECEDADAREAELDAVRERAGWTFERLADEWLDHAQDVRRVKPSTLRDLRSVLAKPGTPKRRGGGELAARLIGMLGDVPAAEVDGEDVDAYLRSLSKGGASARTVNRHRAVLLAIFNFGCSPSSTFKLTSNPVSQTAARREDAAAPLEVFSIEQVEHLCRTAASGTWRTAPEWERSKDFEARLHTEDAEFGELLRVASFTGLRRGELVTLRWDDVRWAERVLLVRHALSDGIETAPKSGRARHVPLADQALSALERLSRRVDFTQPTDYVFVNAVGGRLDPSALRNRYIRVRDAAGLPPLRFHDLRHTAGSLLVRTIDPASVKEILGHADMATTERYLHAQRASLLADAATRAFEPATPTDPTVALLEALRSMPADARADLLREAMS